MHNVSITENGAVGLETSCNSLVDLNYKAASMRNNPKGIKQLFEKAYNENPVLAMKWLFYARDVRGGMGERSISRNILAWLQWKHPDMAIKVLDLLPEYGRWDDVVYMMEFSSTREHAVSIVRDQMKTDIQNVKDDKSVSLLGKWLPSLTASDKKVRMRANYLAKALGMTCEQYRKAYSLLRKKADVLERKLSAKQWEDVDYSRVPSKANLKYKNAFIRHDGDRYNAFIEKANSGEAKINAAALMPYEIVNKYTHGYHAVSGDVDESLEALWKNLPDCNTNGMVILDGSGSMCTRVGNTSVTCHDIADSLAIYFSQHNKGKLNGKFITFGQNPDFVDIQKCSTLRDCLDEVSRHTDCSNTDIFKTYKMLADMAVQFGLSQEDLPDRMIIISDMEFDGCCGTYTEGRRNSYGWGYDHFHQADKTLFDNIKEYWDKAGYKMPKLVFWNVMSRTNTIPMTENELGVILLSGFSTGVVKLAMSDQATPFTALYEVLSSERYKAVEERIMSVKA